MYEPSSVLNGCSLHASPIVSNVNVQTLTPTTELALVDDREHADRKDDPSVKSLVAKHFKTQTQFSAEKFVENFLMFPFVFAGNLEKKIFDKKNSYNSILKNEPKTFIYRTIHKHR